MRLLKNKDRRLTQTFNFSFRYIDDVQSLIKTKFGDSRVYPNQFEVKNTTDT